MNEYKFTYTDLASRALAAKLRKRILQELDDDGGVYTLDFSKVENVSSSFSDELFGVLAAQKGYDWLIQNVKIKNASDFVLRWIAEAINYRLKGMGTAA